MKFVEMALHGCCTSIHFSIQPTRTPIRDGCQGTRAVGWSVVSNFPLHSGVQGGTENAGVENAGAITRGNPSEEIP